MDLSKKELGDEVIAIGESIKAHEEQIKLHLYAVKIDSYFKTLMEKELEKFK